MNLYISLFLVFLTHTLMACLNSKSHSHLPNNLSEERLDAAVDQLLKMYTTTTDSEARHKSSHLHHHHHHRDMSLDLGRRSPPQRASTSWLNTNAGFDQPTYWVKESKAAVKPVQYSPPPSPKRHPISKPRRVVTFEDEMESKDDDTLLTPPASPVTEDKPNPHDAAHRHNRFLALLHLEKPKLLSKRTPKLL